MAEGKLLNFSHLEITISKHWVVVSYSYIFTRGHVQRNLVWLTPTYKMAYLPSAGQLYIAEKSFSKVRRESLNLCIESGNFFRYVF